MRNLILGYKWHIIVLCFIGMAAASVITAFSLKKIADSTGQEKESVVAATDGVVQDGFGYDDGDLQGEKTDEGVLEVNYRADGAYLVDGDGNRVLGPYRAVIDSDGDIWRFIGDNGLMGFLSVETREEITEPLFIRASAMLNGTACVSEGNGIYYIDSEGERFTDGYYTDGYPFAESQGSYARVQSEDGSWGIIDREENFLLEDMDSINELPYMTTMGSGIRDGHAVIFQLIYNARTDEGVQIIGEYSEFPEISEMYGETHAIVKNKEGLYGVIRFGEIIIPAVYTSIDFQYEIDSEEDFLREIVVFVCQKPDGTYDTFVR